MLKIGSRTRTGRRRRRRSATFMVYVVAKMRTVRDDFGHCLTHSYIYNCLYIYNCFTHWDTDTNRVTEIHLERNNLRGNFSDSFAKNLPLLRVLNVHLNFVENFPSNIGSLIHLNEAKFGRNPICGTIPQEFSSLTQLTKFNCNFCCLTGTTPDNMFENISNLEETFWDGNSLTGTLPSSLTRLKSLTKISFNLNNLRGNLPNLCELQNLHDCRLGSDQSFEAYVFVVVA